MLYRGKSDSDWHGFEWSNEERLVKSWGSPPCPPSSPPSTPCTQLNRRWQVFYSLSHSLFYSLFYSLFLLLLPLPLALNSTDDGKLKSIFSISILPFLLRQTSNYKQYFQFLQTYFVTCSDSFKLMLISCIYKCAASHFIRVQIFDKYFPLKNEKFLFPTSHCNFPTVHCFGL